MMRRTVRLSVPDSSWLDRWFGHADRHRWLVRVNLLLSLCAFVIVASLILGGGTRGGFLSDAILEFLAIPLLLVTLWRLFEAPWTKQMRIALSFCFAIAALPLVQLIPLPPWLWTALPNRQPSAAAFDLLRHAVPWMPISVSPHDTWLSALSLLPPLAIFLATLLLTYRERRWLSLVVLTVGTFSVFIGLVQVAQGPESLLRFFEVTNPTEAVGFFANRNHFAALVYALTLFAAAWTVNAAVAAQIGRNRKQYDTTSIVAAIGCFTLLIVFLSGEAMARSRAGLGLTIVALFGAFALGFSDRRAGTGFTPSKLLFSAIALALVFAVQFTLYRIMERFEIDPLADARLTFVHNTIEAAKTYMPLGSGLGTFVPVYGLFEKPEDTLVNTYANHAHNDAVEVWLETGMVGLVLMGLFVIWLVLRSVDIWRSAPPLGAREIDWSLARAATIVVALIVAHSFVDYPLRTGAMMAIMSFACALLIEPPVGAEDAFEPQTVRKRTRHRRGHKSSPVLARLRSMPSASTEPTDVPPRSPDGRWGTNIQWPEEWRKSSEPGSAETTGKSPTSPKPRP
jgi:O-antigen ligase